MRISILNWNEFKSKCPQKTLAVARATKHECKSIARFHKDLSPHINDLEIHEIPIRQAKPYDIAWGIAQIEHATGFQLDKDTILNVTIYVDAWDEKEIVIESVHLWFWCSWRVEE